MMKKVQNSDNSQHDQDAEENRRPFVGENEIDPSETVLRPSFEKLEEYRQAREVSVAKVYKGIKAYEQLHSRIVNGKSEPNPVLLGHLMKGLNLGWMNSVPEPNMEHYSDEWGHVYATASYLPHPFIVEPAGIQNLLTNPRKISDVEAPDIPDSKDAQNKLIAALEEIEERQKKEIVRLKEGRYLSSIKTSERVREKIALREMVASTFVGTSELETMRGTGGILQEERFILLAYPVFHCNLTEIRQGEFDIRWSQTFYLMPVFAHTIEPPAKKFKLYLEEEVSAESAWASMPSHSSVYSDYEMSPFEFFVF